ncbi:MAG: chromate transporter [Angelakisella sp.]|jgi:chromate transporter|nr:chromate transporter [Angelakisella sp.]
MIYLDLFLGFLRVGCFAFGGAYGAIPLIRDVVLSYGWLDDEALTHMIAVSESTPGPIMVNLATYVGNVQGGFLGALLATLAVVLPSFVVILLVMAVFGSLLKNPCTQAVLRGVKPCIIGIILATGCYMTAKSCLLSPGNAAPDPRALIVAALLAGALLGRRALVQKGLSPVRLILLSAFLGALVFR